MNENRHANPAIDDMSTLAAQSKKYLEDNPLLEALTLVIESNAEYARGVTTILDSDLEREVLLNNVKKDLVLIKTLVEKNSERIIQFDGQIIIILDRLEKLDATLAEQLRLKLGPLYTVAGLQESGEVYNPTDKLVVGLQKIMASKIFTMLAGALLLLFAKLILEGIGKLK